MNTARSAKRAVEQEHQRHHRGDPDVQALRPAAEQVADVLADPLAVARRASAGAASSHAHTAVAVAVQDLAHRSPSLRGRVDRRHVPAVLAHQPQPVAQREDARRSPRLAPAPSPARPASRPCAGAAQRQRRPRRRSSWPLAERGDPHARRHQVLELARVAGQVGAQEARHHVLDRRPLAPPAATPPRGARHRRARRRRRERRQIRHHQPAARVPRDRHRQIPRRRPRRPSPGRAARRGAPCARPSPTRPPASARPRRTPARSRSPAPAPRTPAPHRREPGLLRGVGQVRAREVGRERPRLVIRPRHAARRRRPAAAGARLEHVGRAANEQHRQDEPQHRASEPRQK